MYQRECRNNALVQWYCEEERNLEAEDDWLLALRRRVVVPIGIPSRGLWGTSG